MTTGSAAPLETQNARVEIELVMHDDERRWIGFVEREHRLKGLTATVHVELWKCEEEVLAS